MLYQCTLLKTLWILVPPLTGLQEEQVYQAAIAGGKTVSLTYVRLLALGPGQVGKSTFLYRLLGLMEGNIEDTPKEAQPQSSTGQSELRQVCIKYKNLDVAAAPDLCWELCGLQSLVEGLMRLLSNQTQDEGHQSIEITASSPNIYRDKPSSVPKQALPNDTTKFTDSNSSQEQQNASSVNATESTASTSSGPEPSTDPRVVSPTPPIEASNVADLISKTISEYEKLRVECKHSPNVTKLHMLFNIADVGGQPAFLDMLPSLTIGPALYLLFTKLINDNGRVLSIDDLSKLQPVEYRTKDDNEPQDCENYTYTLQEVIFCALSSIACFGLSDKEVEKYVTKESETQKTSSLAMLFGTFADKIDESKSIQLTETESTLKSAFERTDFCRSDLISFPNPSHPDHPNSQVFFQVNNKSGSEEEIARYRKIIQRLVEEKFKKYDIPASWLGLSICLKILATNRDTYKVSFEDCVELGSRYFKLTRQEVRVALTFLHKYIGLVMYFPNDKHLQNIVICNPQVVFSSISELTFSVYDSSSRGKQHIAASLKQKQFEETGIFNPAKVEYPKESSDFMSIHDLVHLLVHLNIAAKITASADDAHSKPPAYENDSQDEYFFPAILKTTVIQTSSSTANLEILPEPLCIRFGTGYMPMGFICALSARLMADEKFSLAPEEQTLYKNKLKLRYNGQFNIFMISLPLRCEFQVTRHYGKKEFYEQDCCPEIMKIIRTSIEYVLKSMQRTLFSEVSYSFAFKCPYHPDSKFGYEPLAILHTEDLNHYLECLDCHTKITDLGREKKIWFGEVRSWFSNVRYNEN